MSPFMLALSLMSAAPVAAESPPAVKDRGPPVLVAQLGGTQQDGLMLVPVLEFKEGKWRALTAESALRTKAPSTWSGFAARKSDGSDLDRVSVRTDTAVKPFKASWGDSYPGIRIPGELADPVWFAVSLKPKDDRARAFMTPASAPLRDALTRKTLAAFPSLEEMGRLLLERPSTNCTGAGGWKEEALSPQEHGTSPQQMMACARGPAGRPLVCGVRITRRMVSTKAPCRADIWVHAWLVGTPERMDVLQLDRGAYEGEAEIYGERASVLLELEGRLFVLTKSVCYEGCDQVSVVELGARDVKRLASGPEQPDSY